ncbi:hypothetical protein DDB_G0280685 [Dictyostelium discoideum AX4]|uniref:hypothetical protein n=1 Tax=Dictyostelium discoideum AX4 TaxID=352472 RepID=UPI00004E41D2|nr:hypothetical protein DDB_G0280685 [Dictyostelium discoideum AX4]EAL67144.1 hypothetical protein DDB_G0280685 [Dictyostelium discoideum AX4]|eukprot:XP_641121.1 hypothetical protein DDB_G0280685 [Dictyostelium discoideum AX4]
MEYSLMGPNSKVTDIIEGTTIFLEYYQKKYPIYKIADLTQPLLKSEVKMRNNADNNSFMAQSIPSENDTNRFP